MKLEMTIFARWDNPQCNPTAKPFGGSARGSRAPYLNKRHHVYCIYFVLSTLFKLDTTSVKYSLISQENFTKRDGVL